MGKKRGKDWGSREDDDLDLSGPSCRHIKKGTDQTLVKKLTGNADWTNCQDCKNEDKADVDSSPPQDTEEESGPIWMCLKCGHRGCGRNSEYKHAIKHYETPRSDPHCLVVSLDNWAVWCYICDNEVQYSQTGHLAQLLTNLKKQTSSETSKRPHQKIKEEEVSEVEQKLDTQESDNKENNENQKQQKKNTKKESTAKLNNSSATQDDRGVSVKGLSNLGNTCFFNAVIQNLSQTQILRDTLNKVTEERMTLNIEPGASSNLKPVTIQLDRPGSLTLTMCQLLNEIQESKKSVVTPRDLFTQVCKKAARFKGFQQQDSQELLRYLLDGMRAEEIKRVSSGLMDLLKESKKGTDEVQLKTLLKEYEEKAFPKNLVDQVFGGEITSTIMCQQCKTVSVVTEMFLDLSLSVSDEAYRKKFQKKAPLKSNNALQELSNDPALTNGSDDVPTESKYQQKKAKKQAKKQAKQQKRQQKLDSKVTIENLTSPEKSKESTEHTAGIEPNKEEAAHNKENPNANTDENNTDAVQAEAESEDDEESITDCDSSVNNRFTLLSDDQLSNNSTLENIKTSDTVQDLNDDSELVSNMEKINLDEAFIEDLDALDQSLKGEDKPLESKEYTVVNQDPELAFQTLSTRSAPEKQECSVQSCLFQFTEVETLTQNNSLLCVTCTKWQHNKGKSRDSKNVYTDALKQMLISSLPPVLTLHLKRFQQNGFSICKVNRHVQFPMILDLASFCSVKCKNTTEGESQILYSLYGIVEHSGTMRSGHYTAYVKVRPHSPNSLSNGISAQGDTEAPKGSWFHISDTSVQPVTESKVQSCQAYLLFYERIL